MFKEEEIVYVKNEGIEYIQFKKLLKYGIKHAYTLKSKNINFAFEQDKNEESYKTLCRALNINYENVVQPVQTHTAEIKCIDKVLSTKDLQNVDGLITNKKVIANVHSGWRGTFQKIAEKAVVKMINFYDCKAEDILCFICPSIRKCHFEVSSDVKELCEGIFEFTNKTEEFIELGEIVDGEQKYNIDTVLINKILLTELGIKEKNIIDCNLCSVCNKDKIESVRVDGANAGRGTAIIML